MVDEPRKVAWDKPIPAALAIDVFREEANRQVELGIDIVRQVLDIDGLFSEDPKYPGVTRAWLEDLTRTLNAERNKLEANEATIAVIGTMKAGKSTVINAVVGSEVVPSRDQPMTTFPTRVVHAPGKTVPELHFPLAGGFNALSEAIRNKDNHLAKAGEDMAKTLDGQPAGGELLLLLGAIRDGTLLFPDRAAGHDQIQEVLGRTNDLTRLAVALEVDPAVATPERLSFVDIPSIEVEFEHLAMLKDQVGGRFAMVDTPGPNEAGKNERLREIVRNQLAEASGIILVLNYNELGSTASGDLIETLQEIPAGQAEQLTILTNRYDQRGAHGLSEQQVKAFACDKMRSVLGFAPEGLEDRIYPTAARSALRAHQAQRALRLSEPIDPSKDGWAEEFAMAGFGVRWRKRPELLLDPEEVEPVIEGLWDQGGFERPLERTLVASARNATTILILSALGKLRERSEPLLEMLNVRDSAFLRSLEELEQLTLGLQSDLRNLDSCLGTAMAMLETIEAQISGEIGKEIETLISGLRSASDKYLKTGKIDVAQRRVSWLDRVLDMMPGSNQGRRFDAKFEEYRVEAEDSNWALRAIGDYGKIKCSSYEESEKLGKKITTQIDALFRHFIKNGSDLIDQATDVFIERAHHDVAALFGKEWQSVHERLEEILGLEISPPKPIGNLDRGLVDIRERSFTAHRHWTETQWENTEGWWVERAAAKFMNWFDYGDRRWGQHETTVSREEHSVDVGQIRKTSLEMADALASNMNAYLTEVLEQLRVQTTNYAEDVQMRVQSINTYILEEIRRGSDESAANLKRRTITSMLAAQARDLISEAIAIRAVVKEMRRG